MSVMKKKIKFQRKENWKVKIFLKNLSRKPAFVDLAGVKCWVVYLIRVDEKSYMTLPWACWCSLYHWTPPLPHDPFSH